MSDLRRLKDGNGPMADLLRAASDDGPSPAARRAIAAAIGVGAGAALVAGTASSAAATTTAASGGAAATGGAVASVGAKVSISIVAKIVVGLALATGVGVAVKHATSSPTVPSPSTTMVSPSTTMVPAPTTTAPTVAITETAPAPVVESAPSAIAPTPPSPSLATPPRAAVAPRDTSPHKPASVDDAHVEASANPVGASTEVHASDAPTSEPAVAAPASTLADEVKLLDQALGALRRKEGSAALLVLARYDAKFPHGSLVPEATVARIQALQLDSQPDEARKVATEFLREHADSPLAARVRRMITP